MMHFLPISYCGYLICLAPNDTLRETARPYCNYIMMDLGRMVDELKACEPSQWLKQKPQVLILAALWGCLPFEQEKTTPVRRFGRLVISGKILYLNFKDNVLMLVRYRS